MKSILKFIVTTYYKKKRKQGITKGGIQWEFLFCFSFYHFCCGFHFLSFLLFAGLFCCGFALLPHFCLPADFQSRLDAHILVASALTICFFLRVVRAGGGVQTHSYFSCRCSFHVWHLDCGSHVCLSGNFMTIDAIEITLNFAGTGNGIGNGIGNGRRGNKRIFLCVFQ